ncbi:hypothetical protein LZ554_008613 [Drepanopeziza brunnea f. sp. 'monogermtubi']|nr:hypothetical protein LZ554_008613 [Drepanopeziza brunnea f. sp. 'monogermtubi']
MDQFNTPAHLTSVSGRFADATPTDSNSFGTSANKSPVSPSNKPTKITKKTVNKKVARKITKKIKSVFASLYDDANEQNRKQTTSAASSFEATSEIKQIQTFSNVESTYPQESPSLPKNSVPADIAPASPDAIEEVEWRMAKITLSPQEEVNTGIRTEWLGTSQFYVDSVLEMQRTGDLDGMIKYREALVHDLGLLCYEPARWIELAQVDTRLGFLDIAAANAHRALLLVEAALQQPISELGMHVYNALAFRHPGSGIETLQDELSYLHRQAYIMLLVGLVGSAAFWDGLVEAKKARKLYPDDTGIAELQDDLKSGFIDRCELMKESGLVFKIENQDLLERTRTGKIFQKRYPWLDDSLYRRTPGTLRLVNEQFQDACRGSCEIKAVAFGGAKPKEAREGEDMGPLGIFATRLIERGELVILDKSITGVSNVPSSSFKHCDACHGSLADQYLRQPPIPCSQCMKAIYCSPDCYKTATEGYHKVLCGHDLDWVYETPSPAKPERRKGTGIGHRWKSALFLRIIAIILADQQYKGHPLQHPLIARATANYPPPTKVPTAFDINYEWHYFENVTAPAKMLQQLGVNIFRDAAWTPEVIQTILWRLENNADMAATTLAGAACRMMNFNTRFLFLNHSCEPNTSWHGAPPDGAVDIQWLRGFGGEVLQPGCSAVWCTAARDILPGEELKISYIGDPLGEAGASEDVEGGRPGKRAWLDKWFDRGCGCRVCEAENVNEERIAEEMRRLEESLELGGDQMVV